MANFNIKAYADPQIFRAEVLRLLCEVVGGAGAAPDYTAQLQALCDKLADGPDGTGGIDEIVDSLQSILAELRGNKDHERETWTDDSGTVYERIVEYDQETNTYTTSYELEDGTAYTPGANPVPYGGGGVDLAPVVVELQNILAQLQGDIDFEESIWCDDTDTVFIRIREYDQENNAYLAPRFELPDGTAYTPTGTPKPCAATSDREFRENSWVATADGTGYSEGDSITQVDIVDTETGAVTATLWYNATTGAYIDPAPAQADLAPATELPELLETKQCVYNCDGGAIVELREIVVSVGGLIQGHSASAYTTADYPDFVGDGSGNVRSYYQNLDGTNIADADRPTKVSCDSAVCPEPCVTFGALFDPATGNLKSGYEVCSRSDLLERIEFDAVTSTLPPFEGQLENTLNDSPDPINPAPNITPGVHWLAGQTPNIVLTYTFSTPQDNIGELIFGNNNGKDWLDHETDEISFVVKDSGGAIIYTQPIIQVPGATGGPSDGVTYETAYPVGILNDVSSVELTLESERNVVSTAGAAVRYFLPAQVRAGITCELFCEDGSPAPEGQSLLPIKGDRFNRVVPGIPQILTAGATWSPPAGTTEVQWKSTGTGNTMTTAGGTGPLGEGSGSIANGPNESIDWSSVVFTAGPAPAELGITYKVAV